MTQPVKGLRFKSKVNTTNNQYATNRIAFIDNSKNGYKGTYRRKRICFDAFYVSSRKFDLNEITQQQLEHFEKTELRGGYCFVLIEFRESRTVYFVPFSVIRHYIYHSKYSGNSQISEDDFNYYAYGVNGTSRATLDYLVWVDKLIGTGVKIRA